MFSYYGFGRGVEDSKCRSLVHVSHCIPRWRVGRAAKHCNTLQQITTHCNTLQHTAAHCSTLQHTATYCSTLQHTAAHCMKVLQCILRHVKSGSLCNTLQHTVSHCSTPQHTATHCNKLQHTATHYNTLQHTATHCRRVVQCNYEELMMKRFFQVIHDSLLF